MHSKPLVKSPSGQLNYAAQSCIRAEAPSSDMVMELLVWTVSGREGSNWVVLGHTRRKGSWKTMRQCSKKTLELNVV